MPELGEPCQYLDWDSEFFGLRVARVVDRDRLDRRSVSEILDWCRRRPVDVLYFLADSGDQATPPVAQEHGFQLVDVRVTLDRTLQPGTFALDPCVCPWEARDLPALAASARVSHHDSRFYFDGRFPAQLCDTLYATWIEKSCGGYADAVFVAHSDDRPSGYISCHLDPGQRGRIGLLAVGAGTRGKGIGGALVGRALGWFADQGVRSVSVVTQGRNCQAQRLYQRCGFVTRSLQLWYHRWFRAPLREGVE